MKRLVIYPTFLCPFPCAFCSTRAKNSLNEMLDSIAKKEIEVENRIYKYMRENLTEKELKKARKYGWEI